MDKDENYIKLIHKLEFKLNGTLTAITKFFLYQVNQRPISGVYVFQKKGNRWYQTSNNTTSTLAIIVMRFKSETFKEIFDNPYSYLSRKIVDNDRVNIAKLEKEFFSWYSPEKNKEKIDLYIDSKTW